VDENASELIFEEWDPVQAVDTSQEPAAMIFNSSQSRAAGFRLDKVIPPQREAAARTELIHETRSRFQHWLDIAVGNRFWIKH
jgi:hypothetical protein